MNLAGSHLETDINECLDTAERYGQVLHSQTLSLNVVDLDVLIRQRRLRTPPLGPLDQTVDALDHRSEVWPHQFEQPIGRGSKVDQQQDSTQEREIGADALPP